MAGRKKARAAWASITEVERGQRYRIRYWGKDSDGQYRRRSETVRGTRRDAERRRAQLMLEHSEDAPCPTVGQAWERWCVPEMEQRIASGDLTRHSLKLYESAWRNHVAPTWADVALDAVRPLRIQQWISGLGASQARYATLTLSKVMDYAVRYEYVDHNPMREKYLMPSKQTIQRADAGVWTLDELGEAWSQLRGKWFEPAFLLAAFGSCRVGESLGPLADEVELRDVDGVPVALVAVVRQVDNAGGVTDALKTEQSRRTVCVPGKAALRLHELSSAIPPDWFLTHDGQGLPQSQRRLGKAWREAGMAHPFRNLRNSWQTNCRWELGMPPWLLEPMMGHAGRDVTGRHYDRPQADVFAEAVARAYSERPFDANWVF
jgi:hypothetical protein